MKWKLWHKYIHMFIYGFFVIYPLSWNILIIRLKSWIMLYIHIYLRKYIHKNIRTYIHAYTNTHTCITFKPVRYGPVQATIFSIDPSWTQKPKLPNSERSWNAQQSDWVRFWCSLLLTDIDTDLYLVNIIVIWRNTYTQICAFINT